ncbi:hypothetical protein J4210_01230 [Candidatus Woesearchaeota archaeon]|nr:hypothetical protein [Candidatus Woesearchaeota archaeon]
MSLANEAAYLYVLSKDLVKVNKKVQKYSQKAQKHLEKHYKATSPEEKARHQHKHARRVTDIHQLMGEHNKILAKLRRHQIAFAHQLQKEHRIK